jgi:hypothetical protein
MNDPRAVNLADEETHVRCSSQLHAEYGERAQ